MCVCVCVNLDIDIDININIYIYTYTYLFIHMVSYRHDGTFLLHLAAKYRARVHRGWYSLRKRYIFW